MSIKDPTFFDVAHLNLLVCPVTKTSITYDEQHQEFVSKESGLAYPIRSGILVLLPEMARSTKKPPI
jgi:uncharacterized protein YbaR (Trm112 family)